jgi:DNA-binding transcriptional ArsR family regulator
MAWQYYEWAKDQPVKPAARKLILLLIADHADIKTLEAHPSQSYLAIESGISERQVSEHLKALGKDGLIQAEECKSDRSRYTYNKYRLLASAQELAPYLDPAKPYLKARAKAAEDRAADVQRRPTNGSPLPLENEGSNGTAASSPTEVWRPGQRKPASVKPTVQTEEKPKEKKDAAGASSAALDADASSMRLGEAPPPPISDDADASSAAAEAAARRSDRLEAARNAKRPPRRKPLPERLDEHLATLGPESVDEILDDLETSRGGITYGWAAKTARAELGLPGYADPHEEPGGELARKIVALAVMRLRKPDGGGLPDLADAWLGDFDWPPGCEEPERESTRKERPQLPRVRYYGSPNDDDKTHQVLYKQVDELSDDELAAKLGQLKQYRKKIFRDSMAEAAEQLDGEGKKWDQRSLENLAFKYAIRHYKGRWPMFVVPVEPKSGVA